ncbi:MAG: flagellar basal body rod protein FlgC [Rhodospirillaceae bacterium]|jgi:flagellar basal-body rod protein FlgC|nr:flagellar basal body rod protein FlgC [Rhodospirillaceae bacterium]MBT4487374.1 flagellar basal body rod protein FlgC [Rhodospirillaceae bacterium]MBT4687640.1 flagellar basal body rod protein FlgC [Rhodospirillaceae bacterium]MBT5191073.1 flagellar basal body rod protein FlgC [Rhodospirillaceae bacterium]MBT5899005.1 flagellar basal body rod protein FlgC [Rhodospirillaceae bacterium]
MDFDKTIQISASGLRAQGVRMRIIAENIANASTKPLAPDMDPYRRKLISFKNELDRELGVRTVSVADITKDQAEFTKRFEPGHPGADKEGYVKIPNVNSMIEMMDMREAQRSYRANIKVIEAAKRMMMRTIDMLK